MALTAALAAAWDAAAIALDDSKDEDLELLLALSLLLLLLLEEELELDFDEDFNELLEFDSELDELDF